MSAPTDPDRDPVREQGPDPTVPDNPGPETAPSIPEPAVDPDSDRS